MMMMMMMMVMMMMMMMMIKKVPLELLQGHSTSRVAVHFKAFSIGQSLLGPWMP